MKPRTSRHESRVELPPRGRSRAGIEFNPRADEWVLPALQATHKLRFSRIPGAHADLIASLKATLFWFVQHRSSGHSANLFATFLHFFSTVSRLDGGGLLESITDITLMNYRAALRSNEKNLSALSGAIKKWHSLGYAGVDESAIRYLAATRIRGNPKGVAVATMDPRTGPLTDLELESLVDALTAAFAAGGVALYDYCATFLFVLIAPRPIQVAALKIRDLVASTARDGSTSYILRVPRAKTRVAAARVEMKERPLPPQVGELLQQHVEETTRSFRELLPDPLDAPMFPGAEALRVAAPGFLFHQSSLTLAVRVRKTLASIAPRSERLDGPMPLTPVRFRRTLGTRLRAEGHELKVIAEVLDHVDLQNVTVYSGLTPQIYERISKKTAFALAPMVRAFQGTLTSSLDPDDRRITDPRLDASMRQPVGCCGTSRTCGFAAPVACYTCRSFRPWVDGPHEAILARLLAEHRRIRDTCDETIAASLVRSILAAAQVVAACKRMRASKTEERHDG